jgi:hypothetical protein
LQAGYPLDAGGVKKSGLSERSEFPDFSRPIASGSPKSQALIFLASSLHQGKEEEALSDTSSCYLYSPAIFIDRIHSLLPKL